MYDKYTIAVFFKKENLVQMRSNQKKKLRIDGAIFDFVTILHFPSVFNVLVSADFQKRWEISNVLI